MSLDIECKPNSHKAKQEAATKKGTPKVKKVVSGTVKTKKKKGVSKLKEALIADSAKDVGSHAFLDVLIPAMKKAFSDIVKDGVDMILYGETRGRKVAQTLLMCHIEHIRTEIEIEEMIADLQILYLIWMILSWNLELMRMMCWMQ